MTHTNWITTSTTYLTHPTVYMWSCLQHSQSPNACTFHWVYLRIMCFIIHIFTPAIITGCYTHPTNKQFSLCPIYINFKQNLRTVPIQWDCLTTHEGCHCVWYTVSQTEEIEAREVTSHDDVHAFQVKW